MITVGDVNADNSPQTVTVYFSVSSGSQAKAPFGFFSTPADGNEAALGSKSIYCDNKNAVKPFGAIDTPTQGGMISGSAAYNWGWVLTPQPNRIPTDGSTISVWVNGIKIGNPDYDRHRADIADLFPGYADSNGAVGLYMFDTTQYANGVHNMHWLATDSAGNTDGIGSRYFTIRNTGADVRYRNGERRQPVDLDGQPFRFLSQLAGYAMDTGTVGIRRGYDDKSPLEQVSVTDNGVVAVDTVELERILIDLNTKGAHSQHLHGFLLAGHILRHHPNASIRRLIY